MNLDEVVKAFRDGRVRGEKGVIPSKKALLTKKSLLIWTGNALIKLRRPILVDGFDQRLFSVRYGMTARERWVGRRLSPSLYLGDAVLQSDENGELRLLPGLEKGEPLVAMRQVDEGHRLDEWFLKEQLLPEDFFPLIDKLVDFYELHEAYKEPPFGDLQAFERMILGLEQKGASLTRPFLGEVLGDLIQTLREDWEKMKERVAHRIREGRVREVHGEVFFEHIFMGWKGEGPLLIDPSDAHESERIKDVLLEIWQLLLPLEMLYGKGFSEPILRYFTKLTGDRGAEKVLPFYKKLSALEWLLRIEEEKGEEEMEAALKEMLRLGIF